MVNRLRLRVTRGHTVIALPGLVIHSLDKQLSPHTCQFELPFVETRVYMALNVSVEGHVNA